jgi:AhpD family alkylhydroperoxidase
MHKNWTEITRELSTLMGKVRQGTPDVAKGFSQMAQASIQDGALSSKHKELMAVAISIAVRCDGCIGFHVKAALQHGATREELMEVIGLAIYMGGGPSFVYGAQALEAYEEFAA